MRLGSTCLSAWRWPGNACVFPTAGSAGLPWALSCEPVTTSLHWAAQPRARAEAGRAAGTRKAPATEVPYFCPQFFSFVPLRDQIFINGHSEEGGAMELHCCQVPSGCKHHTTAWQHIRHKYLLRTWSTRNTLGTKDKATKATDNLEK